MGFNATAVASVQAQIASFPLSKLMQLVQAVDVGGGTVVNNAGVITVGGRALTNAQYYQMYEMIEDMF